MPNPNLVFLLSLLFILLGYFLKRIGLLNEADSKSISKIILNVTLPALILRTITGTTLIPSLIFLPFSAIGYGVLVCGILLFINRKETEADKAILSMGSIGFNNGMFAYPIVEGVFGLVGLQYLAFFDIGSGLSVFGLSYMLAAYFRAKRDQSDFRMTPGIFFRMILGSIPFMSYIAALLLNLSQVPIPAFIDGILAVPARANMFLVLILIGLHLNFSLEGADGKKILQILGLRYVLGILLSIFILNLPIENEQLHGVLSILFILPVSMTILPYSNTFGFEIKTGGVLVNYSILISFFLMWGIINFM
jgi:malate permease and related proteins